MEEVPEESRPSSSLQVLVLWPPVSRRLRRFLRKKNAPSSVRKRTVTHIADAIAAVCG